MGGPTRGIGVDFGVPLVMETATSGVLLAGESLGKSACGLLSQNTHGVAGNDYKVELPTVLLTLFKAQAPQFNHLPHEACFGSAATAATLSIALESGVTWAVGPGADFVFCHFRF